MRNFTRTLVLFAAVSVALVLAPTARAAHDGDGSGCDRPVIRLGTRTNIGRRARPVDRRVAVYAVVGDVPFRLLQPYGDPYYWDWVYAETNHVPGLQRADADCDSRAGPPDTVVFSSELACTCGYPFGYPPITWIFGYEPIPQP